MSRILITGVSGYIGGSLLPLLLLSAQAPEIVYTLVRGQANAQKVRDLGFGAKVECCEFDMEDERAVGEFVLAKGITTVINMANAFSFAPASAFINALSSVQSSAGKPVHFIHTSGAKVFSSHAGYSSDEVLTDVDADALYEKSKTVKSSIPLLQEAAETNQKIHELSKEKGVTYSIVVPPIVYGKGTGFGNKVSIQTLALVSIGKKLGKMYQIGSASNTWATISLPDLLSLYLAILLPSSALSSGYYFASTGDLAWVNLSQRMLIRLHSKNLTSTASLKVAREEDLEEIAGALECPRALVELQVAGLCRLRSENGPKKGWEPKEGVEDFKNRVEDEVDWILENKKD